MASLSPNSKALSQRLTASDFQSCISAFSALSKRKLADESGVSDPSNVWPPKMFNPRVATSNESSSSLPPSSVRLILLSITVVAVGVVGLVASKFARISSALLLSGSTTDAYPSAIDARFAARFSSSPSIFTEARGNLSFANIGESVARLSLKKLASSRKPAVSTTDLSAPSSS